MRVHAWQMIHKASGRRLLGRAWLGTALQQQCMVHGACAPQLPPAVMGSAGSCMKVGRGEAPRSFCAVASLANSCLTPRNSCNVPALSMAYLPESRLLRMETAAKGWP